MAMGTAIQIIIKAASNNILNNIIDVTNFKRIWEEFYTAYSQLGQKVVYFILQELLNYLYTNKPKRFEKSVVNRFANV